jgi:hypothetical protein
LADLERRSVNDAWNRHQAVLYRGANEWGRLRSGSDAPIVACWKFNVRMAAFLLVIALGVLLGVFVSGDDTGLRVVMGGFGAVVGAAVGGALVGFGREPLEKRGIPGVGAKSEDIVANYWRDHGRPPA